jgi:hypothetical protein
MIAKPKAKNPSVGGVLGSDETGLDHPEARLHQKDHERRE